MSLEPRALTLLKTLVERYIAEGQPVGSRALSKLSKLDLSPATIRNIMPIWKKWVLSRVRTPLPEEYRPREAIVYSSIRF